MRRLLIVALTLVTSAITFTAITPVADAAPGALRILVTANDLGAVQSGIPAAIAAEPGVATVDTFDTSTATPSATTLATYDLVVSVGDSSYSDPVTWGNELADYLDAGGAVIQFAYDNWNSPGAFPTGRFESGDYAPFVPGPNDNSPTTLGTIVAPGNPLLAGVTSLHTGDNTTDNLAAGATLLAKWADGRNAIATKGRVESVTASLDSGNISPISAVAQLVVNAGNVLGRQSLSVTKIGNGTGTVVSSPAGISCGSTCTSTFTSGTTVTLTAVPASGSTASLSGAGCSGATCTVTLNSATAVTASFALIPPPLARPTRTRITKVVIKKRKHTASFKFAASGTVTKFQCALLPPRKKGHKKPKLVFRACASPKLYKHLKHGRYKFEVRALNAAGPDLKPAIKKFTI